VKTVANPTEATYYGLLPGKKTGHGRDAASLPLIINSSKGLGSIMKFTRALLIAVSAAGLCVSALAQTPPRKDSRGRARLPGAAARDAARGGNDGGRARLPAAAQPAPGSSSKDSTGEVKAVTQALMEEIDKRSELMTNIEFLCDMIGPRLTGSPNLTKANNWTKDKFQQYGLSNAHLEPWLIDRAWTRGDAKGRVVVPVEQRILLESSGWSPSTDGPKRGQVVHVKAQSVDELAPYKGRLKGAWVVLLEASVQPSPKQPRTNLDGEMKKRINNYIRMRTFGPQLKKFLVAEGVAGILRDSNKEHGLVDMTGASANFSPAELPEAFLTNESYGLIWRLLKRGPVEVEIDLQNTFSKGEVEVFNTVAEIPGSDKADEVVLIGGHIDSWDLGTGATDNGTGIMAVLEAARALKAVGVKPKRTIRCVLFSGEEEGLHGSRAYVKSHEKEMSKISGVLIHDMGTGRVKSIGLQHRYDLFELMDKVVEPFKENVSLEDLSPRNMMGTDHLSFLPHGVPAFAVVQDEAEYRKTHHTESDTFDKVYPDEVNQGAKVLAAWAYSVAMLPEILPRNPKPAEPGMFDSPEFQQKRDRKPDSEEPKQEKAKASQAAAQ
jgi:carboxypeptidase Q